MPLRINLVRGFCPKCDEKLEAHTLSSALFCKAYACISRPKPKINALNMKVDVLVLTMEWLRVEAKQ